MKTVVITGGASGIGFATAKHLVKCGYSILIVDIEKELKMDSFNDLSQSEIENIYYLQSDLSKWESAANVFKFCQDHELQIFCLINNVSLRTNTDIMHENFASWNATFDVTLRAAFTLAQAFINDSSYEGYRYIINIGSITSDLYSAQSPAYHIAKGGIESLTKYLAVAGPSKNRAMNANCLKLGFIVQERNHKKFNSPENSKYKNIALNHLPNKRVGAEFDIGNAIEFLISGKGDFINGAIIPLDGGATLTEQFTLLWSNS